MTRSRSTADDQRTRIVASALVGFARAGYHATPVAEIAELAGVSPAYVFRLFPGKLGLFIATVDRCYELVTAALVEGGEAADARDPQSVLDSMTEAYIGLIADRNLMMIQVHAQSSSDVPEIRDAVRRGLASVVRAVTRVSGADPLSVQRFIAYGQLCHLVVQAELNELDASWAETITAGIRHAE